jgi:hypothetical protein
MKQDRKLPAADLEAAVAAEAVETTVAAMIADRASVVNPVGKTQRSKTYARDSGSCSQRDTDGNRCLQQMRTTVCHPH